MTRGFLARDKKRVVDLPVEKWRACFFGLDDRTAAAAFGDDDLRDIEERVNARDLMHFLADESHRFGIGDDRDLYADGGSDDGLAWCVVA